MIKIELEGKKLRFETNVVKDNNKDMKTWLLKWTGNIDEMLVYQWEIFKERLNSQH